MKSVSWRPASAMLMGLSRARSEQAAEQLERPLVQKELSYALLRQKILSILRKDGDSDEDDKTAAQRTRRNRLGPVRQARQEQVDQPPAPPARDDSPEAVKPSIPCTVPRGILVKGRKGTGPSDTALGRGSTTVSRQSTLTTEGSICSEPGGGRRRRRKKTRRPHIILRPPSPPDVVTAVSEKKDEHQGRKQSNHLRVPQLQRNLKMAPGKNGLQQSRNPRKESYQHVSEPLPEPEEKKTKQAHSRWINSSVTLALAVKNSLDIRKKNQIKNKWNPEDTQTTNESWVLHSETQELDENRLQYQRNEENTERSFPVRQKVTAGVNTDLSMVREGQPFRPLTRKDCLPIEESKRTQPVNPLPPTPQEVESMTGGALDCWNVYTKLASKGCRVSLTTLHRALLTPTELRLLEESSRIRRS